MRIVLRIILRNISINMLRNYEFSLSFYRSHCQHKNKAKK